MASFGVLNWSIVIGYLVGTLLLGIVLSRRIHTAEDYYLGDRSTPWWAIGVSVVATYVGALTFLGGPAWAYEEGFSVILIHVNYPLAIFVVVSVFLPFFYNSGVASIFDYLEKRFGLVTRTLMSTVFLFGNIAYSGIMLYTTALVLQFITGIEVIPAILIVATVALIYTTMGGIAAVIWTDVAQTAILLFGAGIVLFLLLHALPGGLLQSLIALDEVGRLDPFNTSRNPEIVATIWTGVVAMSIYHVVVYGVNQMMVQRTLTAKTLGDAKKSYILMGYVAFPIFFTFFLIGILLYQFFEGRVFDNGNMIILEFVRQVEVPGLMGIIAAAAVAAAMSSLDSSLNSMATVTTIDFYQQYWKRSGSPEHYLKASRWFTVMWGVLIVLPAIVFMGSDGSVLETLSKVGSFLVGAKLAAYMLGFYSRHTTEKGLMVGIAAGFLALWWLETATNTAWPWYAAIGGLVSVPVAFVASLLIDGRQASYHEYTVKGQQELFRSEGRAEKENGWYVLPGKIDRASYGLLIYFMLSLGLLWLFKNLS
ncbi:MAG: sodium/solute symporter [Halioglobus sp.]